MNPNRMTEFPVISRGTCEPTERGLAVSKIDLAHAPTSSVWRWNSLKLFRRVAHPLLSALQDSRERAARSIIHDYRHLLPERSGANSFHDDARK
jgi:hypothetical protein